MNWYKIAQLNNQEEFPIDYELIKDAEMYATGANTHNMRKFVQEYVSYTNRLNKKIYENLEEKQELIGIRENYENILKQEISKIKFKNK